MKAFCRSLYKRVMDKKSKQLREKKDKKYKKKEYNGMLKYIKNSIEKNDF